MRTISWDDRVLISTTVRNDKTHNSSHTDTHTVKDAFNVFLSKSQKHTISTCTEVV